MSARAHLYTVRKLPAGKLSIMPHPYGGEQLAAEMQELSHEGIDLVVSLLTPGEISELALQQEAEFCQRQGMNYRSYPIMDHHVPPCSAETFALLDDLKAALAQGKHVAIHCWMGLGRSALIAASVLVLAGFPPAQACQVLSSARGYHVPETEEQRAWVRTFLPQYQAHLSGQQGDTL